MVTCEYRAVVAKCRPGECPRTSARIWYGTPLLRRCEATTWRRSCRCLVLNTGRSPRPLPETMQVEWRIGKWGASSARGRARPWEDPLTDNPLGRWWGWWRWWACFGHLYFTRERLRTCSKRRAVIMATIPTIDISAFLATEAQPSAPCKVSPQGPSVACEACRARSGITPHRHRLVGALTCSPLHPRGRPKGWLRREHGGVGFAVPPGQGDP